MIILSQLELHTMNTNEIEGTRNVEKGQLKHKFALLTDDYQMLDESNDEQTIGRKQINLGQTKEELETRLTDI